MAEAPRDRRDRRILYDYESDAMFGYAAVAYERSIQHELRPYRLLVPVFSISKDRMVPAGTIVMVRPSQAGWYHAPVEPTVDSD